MPGTPIVDGDYKHAVVQVICLLHEGRYHLVFASAELLPAELSAPPGEALLSAEAPRLGGKARLFFRRYVTTAADALACATMEGTLCTVAKSCNLTDKRTTALTFSNDSGNPYRRPCSA